MTPLVTLADTLPAITSTDASNLIGRLIDAGPYAAIGVVSAVVLWRFVIREWIDKRESSKMADRASESSDLALKLKIAEAHRDTSRSLEISSSTLRDLTVKQESLITKLADHADRTT